MPILYEDYALSPERTKDVEVTLTITLVGAPPPPPEEIPAWKLLLIPAGIATLFLSYVSVKR